MTHRLILSLVVLIAPALASGQTFRLTRPVPDNIQTNGSYLYGEPRYGSPSLAHTGIDISIAYDTVRSASDGVVAFIGYNPNDLVGGYEPTGAGNYIWVQSTWGGSALHLLYGHLTKPLVVTNDNVVRGQPIAISGNTGNSTGPHLHFELRLGVRDYGGYRNRRNPELWVAITGMGAIYGNVPGAPNSTRVDITPDPKPRPPYTTFGWALTYNFNDPAIGSDAVYGENYAIGDVKPGNYVITALGGSYRREVTVQAGQVVNADAPAVSAEAVAIVPQIVTLSQNYPNPFNPVTELRLDLPSEHHISVTVHDMLGRAVGTLADGTYGAGRHLLRFEADGLPSGVYFCRLLAIRVSDGNQSSAVRRMVLQR